MLKKILRNISHFFFPSICLHCHELMKESKPFCNPCLSLLTFSSKDNISISNGIYRTYTFEKMGPAKEFVCQIKKNNSFFMKAAASYMVVQFMQLNWPFPGLILPFCREDDILAKEVSKILKIPVKRPSRFFRKPILEKEETILVISCENPPQVELSFVSTNQKQKIYLLAFVGRQY